MYRFILALIFVFALFSVFQSNQTIAADGEALFKSLGCGACHKPDKKTVGSPLPAITQAYKSEDGLVKFFKGENKPIMAKELPKTMEKPMEKIGKLSDEEKKALAKYMIGFK